MRRAEDGGAEDGGAEDGGDLTPPRRFLLGASLVLIGFNLRIPIASLGPVLPEAVRATGLSPLAASVLTTLPSLCFGLFSPLAPAFSRRIGAERTVLLMLAALALGTVLRAVASAPALFAAQILACLGIAAINVLAPALMKRDFQGRAALMTGLFTMSLCLGAALSAGTIVPLQRRLGGSWSLALAAWGLPALLTLVLWAALLPRRGEVVRHIARPRSLWRDRLAWQVTLFMGLQSALAYLVFGWLAPILRDRGLSPQAAGYLLSLSILGQAVTSLIAPSLAARGRDQRGVAVLFSALAVASLLACLFAPPGVLWLAACLLGLSQGGLFGVALMLIVLRARDALVAAQLSAMAQGVGYLLASLGPLLAGLLHSATGGWTLVAVWITAIGAAMAWSGAGAGRALYVGKTPESAAAITGASAR